MVQEITIVLKVKENQIFFADHANEYQVSNAESLSHFLKELVQEKTDYSK